MELTDFGVFGGNLDGVFGEACCESVIGECEVSKWNAELTGTLFWLLLEIPCFVLKCWSFSCDVLFNDELW